MNKLLRAALLTGTVVIFCGAVSLHVCAGEPASGSIRSGIQAGEIEVRTTANKDSFRMGSMVHFTVTAVNTGDTPRSLTFPTGQNFDITVTPTGKDAPQWQWSRDKMFTMIVRDVTLQPGQKLTFTTEWNQEDNDGNMMPRGEVEVRTKLCSSNLGIDAPVVKLELRP